MREKSIERETALSFVREKRSRVHPNPGFWEQLGVWHECHYEVFELVGDVELGKEVYREWKTKAELEMSNKVLTLNAINTKSGRKIWGVAIRRRLSDLSFCVDHSSGFDFSFCSMSWTKWKYYTTSSFTTFMATSWNSATVLTLAEGSNIGDGTAMWWDEQKEKMRTP